MSHGSSSVQYYDDMARFRRPDKSADRIFLARRVNNWVKQELIRQHMAGTRFLDLGCGRGGDLHKLSKVGAKNYTGVDTSRASLAEAASRCAAMGLAYNLLEHYVFDASLPRLLRAPYDGAVSNFVVQNAASQSQLRQFFVNAETVLATGAHLIVTLPDFERLADLKRGAASPASVRVLFDARDAPLVPFESYRFEMDDAVAHSHEFAVPRDALLDAAQTLRLVEEGTFADVVARAKTVPSNTGRVGDVSALYRYAVFRKE